MSVDQKILKATKFPPEFDKRVDTSKVNIDLMKKWIAGKITAILGYDDDVVVETCYNLLEENRFVRFLIRSAFYLLLTSSCSPKLRKFRSNSAASSTRIVLHSAKSCGI